MTAGDFTVEDPVICAAAPEPESTPQAFVAARAAGYREPNPCVETRNRTVDVLADELSITQSPSTASSNCVAAGSSVGFCKSLSVTLTLRVMMCWRAPPARTLGVP